jgi:hypothetical protein
MNIKNIGDGNIAIHGAILSGIPFIASKMGATESVVISNYNNGRFNEWIRETACTKSGIYPTDDLTLNFFYHKYTEALQNVDMLGVINAEGYIYEEPLIRQYCTKSSLYGNRFLEPFYFDMPWSEALEGKDVLVIHPFEDSIISQYKKRELLFNKNVLPKFNLLTIRAEQTIANRMDGSLSFIESFYLMLEKVKITDFDVALIACGAYGLLLADEVKKMNKQAVHICGGLQIMFGIKGKRWDDHDEISLLYNDHWVRPLETEKPRGHELVEDSCYW